MNYLDCSYSGLIKLLRSANPNFLFLILIVKHTVQHQNIKIYTASCIQKMNYTDWIVHQDLR